MKIKVHDSYLVEINLPTIVNKRNPKTLLLEDIKEMKWVPCTALVLGIGVGKDDIYFKIEVIIGDGCHKERIMTFNQKDIKFKELDLHKVQEINIE